MEMMKIRAKISLIEISWNYKSTRIILENSTSIERNQRYSRNFKGLFLFGSSLLSLDCNTCDRNLHQVSF